ncbi:MAG: hypothetical protein WKG00_07260 [Polyangiaceae bacterium]
MSDVRAPSPPPAIPWPSIPRPSIPRPSIPRPSIPRAASTLAASTLAAMALAFAGLTACGAPAAPVAIDLGPPPAPDRDASPAPSDPPPPPPPPLPAELAPPRAACIVRGRRWRTSFPPAQLRAAPSTVAYAAASAGQVELVLADGPTASISPFLRVEAGHLSLAGFVDGAGVRVAPSVAMVVARTFLAMPRLGLEVISVSSAGVVLVPVFGAEASLEPSAALDPVACDALTLDSLPIDPRGVMGTRLRWAALPIGRDVPLSVSAGIPPHARLTAAETSANVEVMEVTGADTRIVWELPNGWIIGWVRSAALVARREPLGALFTMSKPPPPPEPLSRVVCTEDVALVADTPAGPRVAGVARAGATIELLDRGVGMRKARVRDEGAATADAPGVSVREADIERCRRPP